MSKSDSKMVPEKYTPQWLSSMDGRTTLAIQLKHRHAEICQDLGGAESLSYIQRSLVSRYLFTEFWIAQQEADMASGEDVDMGRYTQACNSLAGLANKLGLQRTARDVPSLHDVIAANGGNK